MRFVSSRSKFRICFFGSLAILFICSALFQNCAQNKFEDSSNAPIGEVLVRSKESSSSSLSNILAQVTIGGAVYGTSSLLQDNVFLFVDGKKVAKTTPRIEASENTDFRNPRLLAENKGGFKFAIPDKFYDNKKHSIKVCRTDKGDQCSKEKKLNLTNTYFKLNKSSGIFGWVIGTQDYRELLRLVVDGNDETIVDINKYSYLILKAKSFYLSIPKKYRDGNNHDIKIYRFNRSTQKKVGKAIYSATVKFRLGKAPVRTRNTIGKKGIGKSLYSEEVADLDALESLNLNWYYTWGFQQFALDDENSLDGVEFVPMIRSVKLGIARCDSLLENSIQQDDFKNICESDSGEPQDYTNFKNRDKENESFGQLSVQVLKSQAETTSSTFPYVLLYNEPDNDKQDNHYFDAADGVTFWRRFIWPSLSSVTTEFVSPAMMGVEKNDWQTTFFNTIMDSQSKIPVRAIHFYPNPFDVDECKSATYTEDGTQICSADELVKSFLRKIDKYHQDVNKVIWITEFAVAEWTTKDYCKDKDLKLNLKDCPPRIKPEYVKKFMCKVLPEIQKRTYIKKYAWFPVDVDDDRRFVLNASAIYKNRINLEGQLEAVELTDLGKIYAAFNGDDFIDNGVDLCADYNIN